MKLVTTTPEGETGRDFHSLWRNTTTSKIHYACGSQSFCGASRKHTAAMLAFIQSAPDALWCEKCFPCGKPDAVFEIVV